MSKNTTDELREQLAAIEHERWSDWQKWCHQVLRENMGANADLEKVLERWDKQIATPYAELSDQEKTSDMEQVDRYWNLIEEYISNREKLARINELENGMLINTNSPSILTGYIHHRLATLRKELDGGSDK